MMAIFGFVVMMLIGIYLAINGAVWELIMIRFAGRPSFSAFILFLVGSGLIYFAVVHRPFHIVIS